MVLLLKLDLMLLEVRVLNKELLLLKKVRRGVADVYGGTHGVLLEVLRPEVVL